MNETLKLIWKKSPLKILLVLAVLLSALGYFENTAKTLRARDIVIEIKEDKNIFVSKNTAGDAGEEELSVGAYSADMAEWYIKLKSKPSIELRAEWEGFNQKAALEDSRDLFFFEIRLLMAEGREDDALELLRDFLPTEDDADSFYLLKAVIENRTGLRSDSIASYQQLLKLSPNSFPAHYNLGSLYYQLNRFSLAKGYLEEAVRLTGGLNKAKAYRALAKTMIKLEDYTAAEKMLLESILLDPSGLASRFALAELYSGPLNDIQEARSVYETIGKLGQDLPELYLGLARIELTEDDWGQALEVLEDAMLHVSDSLPLILETARIKIEWDNAAGVLELLEENRKLYPDSPNISFQTGRVYYKTGDFNKAADAFAEAIEKSSEPYLEAINNLGLVYMAQDVWDRAEQQYLQAVTVNPWYETAYYNLGLVYLNQELWIESGDSFKKALQIEPEYQAAWYNLGIVYSNLGRLDDAVSSYEQALLLQPEDSKARLNLAVLYRKKGNDAKAREQYRLVLEINPAYASAWFNLGLLQKEQGMYKDAELSYRKAIELDPEQEIYWMNLSSLLGVQEKTDQAASVLLEALEIHPNSSALRYNLALQYKKSGKIDDAIEQTLVSLKLDPGFAKGWKTTGSLQSDIGNHRVAADAFQRSAGIDDADKYIYYLLGKEQYASGDVSAAIDSFEKALTEITDNAFIWYNAGRAYHAAGQSAKASSYYSIALDINPDLAVNIADEMVLLDESGNIYYSKIKEDPGNPAWPLQLAKHLLRTENPDEAKKVLLEAKNKFQKNVSILIELAELYEDMGDFLSAEASFVEAMAIAPEDINFYIRLGKLMEKSGNPEAAEGYLLQGVVIKPDNIDLLSLLGETYYDQKKYQETIDVLSRAFKQGFNSGLSWITLGKAYYRIGNYADAEAAFREGKQYEQDYIWSYIWYGRALRKLEKWEESESEFKTAAELDPEHKQAWLALGDLYRERNFAEPALEAYTKALDLDPTDNTVRRRVESVE